MRVLTYSTTITLTQHTYMLGSGTAGAFLFLPTPPHLWHRARNSGIVPSFLAPAPYLWPRALYVYLLSVSVSRTWATTLRQKRTKTSILCSKRPKMGVPKAKSAQKPRFCARGDWDWHREGRKLVSESITAETFIANMSFEQITARVSKMQKPHNQIINFYKRAR